MADCFDDNKDRRGLVVPVFLGAFRVASPIMKPIMDLIMVSFEMCYLLDNRHMFS